MKRLTKAEKELGYAYRFNHIIVNTDLEKAKEEAGLLVKGFLAEEVPDPEE